MTSTLRRPARTVSLLLMLFGFNIPATVDDPDNAWLFAVAGVSALFACSVSGGPRMPRKLRSGKHFFGLWSVLLIDALAAGLSGLTPGQFLATVGCTATVFISICSILEDRSQRRTTN
jgi:peptidoglycan/LPS O-acetylase OafA/YrhL